MSSVAILWFNTGNSVVNVWLCGTREADRMKRKANARDGADISRGDFTGPDFTAWVHDLFRPHEPYENHGTHPSGVGMERYRGLSALTPEERRYPRPQGRLQLLNLLDPFLLGVTDPLGRNPFSRAPLHWNALARHPLTSFGYVIDANLVLRHGKWKELVTPTLTTIMTPCSLALRRNGSDIPPEAEEPRCSGHLQWRSGCSQRIRGPKRPKSACCWGSGWTSRSAVSGKYTWKILPRRKGGRLVP